MRLLHVAILALTRETSCFTFDESEKSAYVGEEFTFKVEFTPEEIEENQKNGQVLKFCLDQLCDINEECSAISDFSGAVAMGKTIKSSDGGDFANCSVYEFPPDSEITFTGKASKAGFFQFQVTPIYDEKVEFQLSMTINTRISRAKWIYVLDQIIGWTYFVLWSVSFYPQVIMNFRRKSVVGFNMDFLGYDLAGFLSFSAYNCLIFFSPAVFRLYQTQFPGASNPIQINDVFFCIHAVFIQGINSYQCLTYERGGQGLSKICKIILILTSIALSAMMIIAGTGILVNIGWWEVLSFTSYIKIGSSVIKYMPQVYLNWKRKCTLGFAIDMALLDITGGTACYIQTLVQFINANDFAIISGNIGKIGIGFVSCFFDVILLVQHFCLYGKNNARKLEELAAEEDSKSPLVSQDISRSRQGFSPTTSAVLYHAPKGDFLASTASFRDVFSSQANVQPDQTWTDVMVSITGSRAFGHERVSVSNSKGNIVAMERRS